MKIAIVITTYQKEDGQTPALLTRTLEHIKNQSFQDYKVFLIGDKYEDEEEFNRLASIIDPEKMYSENLPYAAEREKYTGTALWCTGGVNARNHGISVALSQGFSYIANSDHDDFWEPNHLEEIHKKIEEGYFLIGTICKYLHQFLVPSYIAEDTEFYPVLGDYSKTIIHSASCLDYSKTSIRYRNRVDEDGSEEASDLRFWADIAEFMRAEGHKGCIISKLTCYHETEHCYNPETDTWN